MNFREMVDADIGRTFLDLDTFGETWRIEGREVSVVVDNDELVKRQGGNDLAVAESGTLFYAKAEDLPRRAPNQSLNVNGRECIIDSWSVDMGMATVVLRENIAG